MEGGGGRDAFRDLHFGIMSTFVNVKIDLSRIPF